MTRSSPGWEPTTIVLLDPTNHDGESSLDLLSPADRNVALVVLLTGPFCSALVEYAASEDIDVSTAGSLYLDQVAARIGGDDRIVELVTAPGPSSAQEIADLVGANDTRRVIVPSSLERVDPAGYAQLAEAVGSIVEAAPQGPDVTAHRRWRTTVPRFLRSKPRTVREVLEDLGVPPSTIAEAELDGTAELLAIDSVALPERASLTMDELAAKVGADVEELQAFWRALGFVDPVEGERSFTKRDVTILKSLVALTEDGLVDRDLALPMARVVGVSMAQVAAAILDASGARSNQQRGVLAGAMARDDADSLAVRAGEMLPFMADVIDYAFRRHLRAATRRRISLASSVDGASEVIGFADLVRYTELSSQLDEPELARLVGRFYEIVADVVVRHDGRIVKMLGDGAMFTVVDPVQAGLAVLELSDAIADDDRLPGLRVGMARGPVLAHDGDLYGPVVNMASRLGTIGRAGAINVNQDLRDAIARDPRFTLRSLGHRTLRHIGNVRVYRLRPGPEWIAISAHDDRST